MDDRILVEVYIPFVQTSLASICHYRQSFRIVWMYVLHISKRNKYQYKNSFICIMKMTRRFWQWIAVLPKVVYIQHPISFLI